MLMTSFCTIKIKYAYTQRTRLHNKLHTYLQNTHNTFADTHLHTDGGRLLCLAVTGSAAALYVLVSYYGTLMVVRTGFKPALKG